MSNVLAAKDANMNIASTAAQDQPGKPDIKSMEYHRQVLQSKMDQAQGQTYISPSDNIMSPCTAKLSAFRNKQVGKVKPKSLFAKASAKKLGGDGLFDSKP
ncbi:hypothetical protein CONLIGDRAFT_680392 [Coniochaeta ligniaria NRRL 30616]|uniref:Spo12-like protein n=1 Tax=Coniochaeta ligniaria NRRL 30616 TaxID=1408157 RepID=A0A1J7IQB5_9PEZI|nr:hypothetical protein CONLIGDRAFT_680392 [Coniochaeta ligniaria NRRL 30616]